MHRQQSHLEEWAALLDEAVSENVRDQADLTDDTVDWSTPGEHE